MVGAFVVCLLFSRYDAHYPFKSVIVELLVAGRKHPMDGWMICGFTFFSAVFQSYQDDERVNMKCSVQ